jgi:FkbM family methyltransferase
MRVYRRAMNFKTPSVTEIEIDGTTGSFYTRTTAETHQIHGPAQGEIPVIREVLQDLSPDDIFYDIGANAGLYTVFAAKSVSQGAVHAFEPIPANIERLRENLQLSGVEVEVHPFAIGSSDETVTMTTPDALSHGTPEVTSESDNDTINVEQRSIDSLIESNVQTPNVVKIDVEGYEMSVIKGAEKLLRESPPRSIYIELHEDGRSEAVQNELEEAGYTTSVFHERSHESYLKATRS